MPPDMKKLKKDYLYCRGPTICQHYGSGFLRPKRRIWVLTKASVLHALCYIGHTVCSCGQHRAPDAPIHLNQSPLQTGLWCIYSFESRIEDGMWEFPKIKGPNITDPKILGILLQGHPRHGPRSYRTAIWSHCCGSFGPYGWQPES